MPSMHFTVVGGDLCCLFLGSELPVGSTNRQLCSIREDEGSYSTDHHMTRMSCAERAGGELASP